MVGILKADREVSGKILLGKVPKNCLLVVTYLCPYGYLVTFMFLCRILIIDNNTITRMMYHLTWARVPRNVR